MPLEHVILMLLASIGAMAATWSIAPRIRADQSRLVPWLCLAAGAVLLSGASWYVAEEGWGGTLRIRRHGWPKFFATDCLSADCEHAGSFDLLYFLGNSFFYAAILIVGWTLLLLLRRRRG